MSEPTVFGACLCGAVRFRIELPTLFCGHCHCTMCQRNHGAAYVTWFGIELQRCKFVDHFLRKPVDQHIGRSRVVASSGNPETSQCAQADRHATDSTATTPRHWVTI